MLHKNTLLKIKDLALNIDHDVAFDGKSKGNRHLFRVVKLATFMAKRLRADAAIAEAAAWLHDTAIPTGDDYDYRTNKRIVRVLLAGLSIPRQDSALIAECAASHEGTARPRLLEGKIVHDADVLEKSGLLGVIRHTWKVTNSGGLVPERVTRGDVMRIMRHLEWRAKRLQTSLGKKMHTYLALPLSFRKAGEIIATVADKAAQGIITERIARLLYRKLTKAQREKLKEQLSLRYLRRFDSKSGS